MPEASLEEVLNVSRDKLFDVIVRYEDYPQFVSGIVRSTVERKQPGSAKVDYTMNMLKEITYSIVTKEDREQGRISWELLESGFMKKNNGSWTLTEAGPGKTKVLYKIEIEFSFPVPGFIVKKLVKGSIPDMLQEFENRASR